MYDCFQSETAGLNVCNETLGLQSLTYLPSELLQKKFVNSYLQEEEKHMPVKSSPMYIKHDSIQTIQEDIVEGLRLIPRNIDLSNSWYLE